jgi:hypothetical protein
MEKQLTAVEWLIEQIGDMYLHSVYHKQFEQAKEMEKQQRKEDFRAGWYRNKHKDWNCEFYLEKYITNDFKSE